MAKSDVLVRMKADVSNYDANIAKARRTLDGFKQDNLTLGGILNQTTKSLTAAAAGFASIAAAAATMKSVIDESVQLAKAGEGIRIAFERLNRPDLLDGLRQATHNTVTDIELMKQAVKFNDFRLSLDDMGAMLAFAQQKAKDTGESIDYMVNSITTGLGRQSLMILDNLGLSASEIRERMKETGDMTKAVAEIIREKMDAAGGYVETAADRAAQADKRLKDSMEQLGETLTPLSSATSTFWTDFKRQAIDALNDAVIPLIAAMKYLGLVSEQASQKMPEQKKSNPWSAQNTGTLGTYVETTDANGNVIYSKHYDGEITDADRASYDQELAKVRASIKSGKSGNKFDASKIAFTGGAGFKAEDTMPSVWAMLGDSGLRSMLGIGRQQDDYGKDITNRWKLNKKGQLVDKDKDNEEKTATETLQGIQTMVGSLQSILSGIETLGIEIPKELTNIIGVLQTITGIVGSIQALQQVGTWLGLFHNGGIVKAFSGTLVGNTYSGDQLRGIDQSGQIYGLNAGELVLNRAQVGNLASSLSGGMQQTSSSPYVTGEMIYLGLTNYLKSTGRGEIMTSRFKQ